jgi:hypothetical protein
LRCVASPDFGKSGVTADQQQKDSPDKVVDVPSANDNVTKWPDVMRNRVDEQARREECDKEGDGRKKETAVGPVGDSLVKDDANFGEVQQDECCCSHESDEDEQYPGTWDVHASACITTARPGLDVMSVERADVDRPSSITRSF